MLAKITGMILYMQVKHIESIFLEKQEARAVPSTEAIAR